MSGHVNIKNTKSFREKIFFFFYVQISHLGYDSRKQGGDTGEWEPPTSWTY